VSALVVGVLVFGCGIGGALIGVFIGRRLPPQHMNSDTKEVVRLGMGMVATIAALVLGLLIASAKEFYDNQKEELAHVSANVVLLDRLLRHYGPEADAGRTVLRQSVARSLETIWPAEHTRIDAAPKMAQAERLYDLIQGLAPADNRQRSIQSEAMSLAVNLGQTRWLMFEETQTSFSRPLLAVLLLWVTSIFLSWGIYSPLNATTLAVFLVAALSVSASVVLIVELYSPFNGLLRIPNLPLRLAYAELGH